MTEQIRDAVGWGIATGITLGVAGATMKGIKRMTAPRRYYRRKKKR
jgi:hypothetical protein